jgi:hypothetical protein
MMTALPTAHPAYGLEGPSAGRTMDNATRKAPLISAEILSNQTGPALVAIVAALQDHEPRR